MFSITNIIQRRLPICSRSITKHFFHASTIDLSKLNVEGLAERVDLSGQNVLVRVDLNVPLSKEVSIRYLKFILVYEISLINRIPAAICLLMSIGRCNSYG